jgi:methylmalonyl-CoA/ethylmalonyl-CoA epimerase
MSIHHIGYAVDDIEKAYMVLSMLGYEKCEYSCAKMGGGGVVEDIDRNIKILMLKNRSICVELVSFLDRKKSSPIDFLFKSKSTFPGNGIPYHICYNVDNITETIDLLKTKRFIIIQSPCKAIALGNSTVAFLFHKDIGIIELYEKSVL